MTAAQPLNAPSPFSLKQERDDFSNDNNAGDDNDSDKNCENEDDNDDEDEDEDEDDENEDYDDDEDDANSVSSLPQPSILDKDSYDLADPKDEFLRLTSMVRRVYFSYLHKSVIANYNACYRSEEKEASKCELKKFASQMELCAVKAALEASLYRRTMLKMISDIKSNTSGALVHKKLKAYLERVSEKVDVGVQTSEDERAAPLVPASSRGPGDVHIQSANVTSNFDENKGDEKSQERKNLDERICELLKPEAKNSVKREPGIKSDRLRPSREISDSSIKRNNRNLLTPKIAAMNKDKKIQETKINCVVAPPPRPREREESETVPVSQRARSELCKDLKDIFGTEESSSLVVEPPRNEDDGSQDSLMQHLEDMFCESDDSSDLMTLIEKHSGVSKANVDSEIVKMCPEEPPIPAARTIAAGQKNSGKPIERTTDSRTSNKRKLSFGNYKKMKKRAMGEPETPPHEETTEERQERKIRGIWFVERIHQVTKLQAKMTELSARNYRKHGRICAKFIQLFGDPDEEDSMPESPIRIEEHLTACKERIAPWVVKYLMPYYTKRVIQNRGLFKAVAKHIADMLIIENTFPEEDCVAACIKDYFRNKTCIKAESDIYI